MGRQSNRYIIKIKPEVSCHCPSLKKVLPRLIPCHCHPHYVIHTSESISFRLYRPHPVSLLACSPALIALSWSSPWSTPLLASMCLPNRSALCSLCTTHRSEQNLQSVHYCDSDMDFIEIDYTISYWPYDGCGCRSTGPVCSGSRDCRE